MLTPGKQWSSTTHAPPDGVQRDPTVRSVAALLTYKLKNGETPPDTGHHHQPESCSACSFCHGDGAVVLDVPESDPDYGKAIPCSGYGHRFGHLPISSSAKPPSGGVSGEICPENPPSGRGLRA